jgi:hypothetical protein
VPSASRHGIGRFVNKLQRGFTAEIAESAEVGKHEEMSRRALGSRRQAGTGAEGFTAEIAESAEGGKQRRCPGVLCDLCGKRRRREAEWGSEHQLSYCKSGLLARLSVVARAVAGPGVASEAVVGFPEGFLEDEEGDAGGHGSVEVGIGAAGPDLTGSEHQLSY